MIRLFVAIPMPQQITEALQSIAHGLHGVRWVPPENYHLTLRFIGEVHNGDADDYDAALSQVNAPPVEINCEGLGFFDKKGKVHTLHMKVAKTESLVHLQKKVESALVRAGLSPEPRKFSPHITLARMKPKPVEPVQKYCAERTHHLPKDMAFHATHFSLYSSLLTHNGSIYTQEVDYPLMGSVAEMMHA